MKTFVFCICDILLWLFSGQHNDARMNLAIALTAVRHGAAVANYTEVVHLLKKPDPKTGQEKVCGAHCRDIVTGKIGPDRKLN